MKHIDISALPLEPDDELRAGETYAVERDGEVVGYFVPRKKKDPEEVARALEAFDRTLQRTLGPDYSRDQFADDVDLSRPLRDAS